MPQPTSFMSVVRPQLAACKWPIIAALVLTSISGAAISVQNVFPKWLFSEVLEPKDMQTAERWRMLLLLVAGYLVVSFFLRMALWHIGYRIFTRARERIVFHVRAAFFAHVNHLCLRFHGQHPSGELFSYLFGSPLASVVAFLQHATMMLPHTAVALIATLAMFWGWDWAVATTLLCTSLLSVGMMNLSRKRMQAIASEFQKTEGDVSGQVADLLRGTRAVKLYAMERSIADDFAVQARLIAEKTVERDVRSHMEWMKQEGLGYIAFSALVAVCAWRYLDGHIDLGTVAACFTSYAALQWPLQTLFQAMTMYGTATASAQRIDAVMRTASTTPDPVGAESPVPARGDFRLHGVTFAYDSEPILRDVALHIPYGQKLAIVGPSGAGKSTLVQLLLRLYDPQQGTVEIDGTDLRRVSGSELRRRFGVVPQDPFIFRTTLRDNLRVARPDASDADLRRACEQANAWEFISALPEGLSTRVGEGGSTLSGGQRQRLAIARVLLADPPFLVFDEATSALDTLSEQLIQQAIERNLGGRTAIFIAHRLATVKHCDRILVVRGGRIEQDGAYDRLVAEPGLFREMVQGQDLRS
ncbi:MAG: ABC transporter ATP-binding protein [Planctomycetes bacterium]|nr:ABC transporter ATP-binding protein [Planctomycetota bacterium]